MGNNYGFYFWRSKSYLKLFVISLLATVMSGYGVFFPISLSADDNINYIESTSSPKIYVEHSLNDGKGGTYDIALVRSYFDPNCNPPTNYTTLVNPGDQYALDSIKVKDNGVWYRVMSDSDNTATGPADGYEDGVGNASSLYDNAMAVIALTSAGETAKAEKILKAFVKDKIYVMMDNDTTGAAHPGGSESNPIKDQAIYVSAVPDFENAMSFDVWKENSPTNDEYLEKDEDLHLADYPRLAPGHEYGIILNQPEDPTWAGVDFDVDVPRVQEVDDINDVDDDSIKNIAPYLEDEYYHGSINAYRMFFQWYDVDHKGSVGTENAEQMMTDKLIPYSSHWQNEEYKYQDYEPSAGDNLWLVIAVLYYSYKTNTDTYLPIAYDILDTLVDNLQDFNGGIHFGYYGCHEVTATSTEHNLDFAFAYHWIEKLHDKGLVDDDHYNVYKKAYEGSISLDSTDIVILDINTGTYASQDDSAVSGADYMLKFLGIPHTVKTIAYDAASLDLPDGCDVLILPETPYQYLGASLKTAIYNFAASGGKIFGTGRAAVNIGKDNNPFGVEFDGMQEVGGSSDGKNPIAFYGRNMVICKVYKDGIDNASTAVDINQNGVFDASEEDTEPTEIDNWEEGLGNLNFAYTPPSPYNYILLWAFPDYKRSRLTYFLSDIGDEYHALNGGKTPNLSAGESRTSNEGNAITVKYYAKDPTVYSANEYGHIPMVIAKVDLEGISDWDSSYNYDDGLIETLYFNEPKDGNGNKGKVVYFIGDMFSFFNDCINHNTVDGVVFSPYKFTYYQSFSTHAQILENALTWFFTDGLDPIYTVRDPYGTTTVYSENQAGEMGYYSPNYNKFGSDSTDPGKSIVTVDLSYNDNWDDSGNTGDRCIKIVKDNSETYGGIWLTRNIEWPDITPMTSGFYKGSYLGAKLAGATSLTFWAKADAPTNVTFGFGIDNGDMGEPETTSDSGKASIDVTLGTTWQKYTIDTSNVNMSWINGLFYAKITSPSGTIYVDEIHYNPRAYGFNDEGVTGKRLLYTEGRNNEGIWSGWFGEYGGGSLTLERQCTDDPHSGYYCCKITKDSSEAYAGIWIQQLGYSTDSNERWSSGPGIGAYLNGCTKLTFWAKSNVASGIDVEFGYGYTNSPGDSSYVRIHTDGTSYPKVDTTWRKYEIDLTGKDLSHINGLFFFTMTDNATLYLDEIKFEPVLSTLGKTYQEDVELGNHDPHIWRKKNLAHLGVKHFLETCVWADSDNFLRLPPGVYEDSEFDNGYVDDYGTPLPDDIAYEKDDIITDQWPAPANWARKKMFIRGQLDFTKAADMHTWGAIYWIDKKNPTADDTANAKALLDGAKDIFLVSVKKDDEYDTTNLALNKTATASSSAASNVTPDKAVDGNLGTRWTSEYSDPQWLQIDLGSAQPVAKVILRWENSTVYDDEYKIQYSDDGTNWSDAYYTNSASGDVHTITFDEITARYWRMYGIHRAGGYGHSLWEMELYSNKRVTSMEYWDISGSPLRVDHPTYGDDFGESVWPEGVGQLIQTAYFLGDYTFADWQKSEMDKVEYTVADGIKAYPYAWPRNMITDNRAENVANEFDWGDDQERLDSLSIAATTWMYIGKNKVEFFANALMPDCYYDDRGVKSTTSVYTWNGGGATFDGNYNDSTAPEGSKSFYTNSANWAGWGVCQSSGTVDMSKYENGYLTFWVKSGQTLKVEIEAPAGTKSAVFIDSTSNQWKEVSIPISDFKTNNPNIDISQVKYFFMITASSSGSFYVDSVRWTSYPAANE